MVFEIGEASRAEAVVRRMIERGDRMMGFGHRVYKVRDPRADVLSRAATTLADQGEAAELHALARAVEETVLRLLEEMKPGRRLKTNVEYYTALLLHGIGLPKELFTPTFAIGRVGGWTAHCFEQLQANRLIRPASIYTGAGARPLDADRASAPEPTASAKLRRARSPPRFGRAARRAMAKSKKTTPAARPMKMYQEIASWWPLLSAPEDYEEEATFYLRTLLARLRAQAAHAARARQRRRQQRVVHEGLFRPGRPGRPLAGHARGEPWRSTRTASTSTATCGRCAWDGRSTASSCTTRSPTC